jgi:UDP-N-acetylglucosamine 2-epimerase (non-hydrolysing)/GDP/UDP-N,N'-diacetylbacillosamine 2-epimerase (hydrolysing)
MAATPPRRRVAIFTGNRAEYGQQYPIIRAIARDPRLEYFLLVSGAHLQEDFGYTVREIEKDGFTVHGEVVLTMTEDTLYATAQAIGSGILSLAQHLAALRPDWLVVSADRYEAFSAMIAGTQMNVPTAHIEGGDLTNGGALDDSVRHAMTKLAHVHFVTNAEAAARVRALGEEPWRIHTVGLPMLDLLAEGNYAGSDEIASVLGLSPDRPVVAFTQHSVTTEFELATEQLRPSLDAMEELARDGYQIVITYPNNDAGGLNMIRVLEELRARAVPEVRILPSLGRSRYHGLLHYCGRVARGACVGNSSSGIKETPAFGCPTVNIGSRQDGRLRATNVLDVGYDAKEIVAAVRRCVEDAAFRHACATCENPYGQGHAGPRIAEALATIELDRALVQKKMSY